MTQPPGEPQHGQSPLGPDGLGRPSGPAPSSSDSGSPAAPTAAQQAAELQRLLQQDHGVPDREPPMPEGLSSATVPDQLVEGAYPSSFASAAEYRAPWAAHPGPLAGEAGATFPPTSFPSAAEYQAPTSLSSASAPEHPAGPGAPLTSIPHWPTPQPASTPLPPAAPLTSAPLAPGAAHASTTQAANVPTAAPHLGATSAPPGRAAFPPVPPVPPQPRYAPPPPSRRGPSVAAVALPLALLTGLAGLGLGWVLKPQQGTAPARTTTITTTPSVARSSTPGTVAPAPAGLSKPVAQIVLPDTLGDLTKAPGATGDNVVQTASYARANDPRSQRFVAVLSQASVASASASGTNVKDYANYRCWSSAAGTQTCAAAAQGGIVTASAAAGFANQEALAEFMALLLKANA